MAQTKKGADKMNATIVRRYGEDFFVTRASKGGKASIAKGGGFKKGSQKAIDAGRKGALKRWKKRSDGGETS